MDYSGYDYVMLKDVNGKKHKKYVCELVANAFVPNPKHYKYIHHSDGNIHNNNATNLFWSNKK